MNIVELAKEAESRGLILCGYRSTRTCQRPLSIRGLPIPKDYAHTYDPFVTLSAMASVTSKIKLATGICLIIITYDISRSMKTPIKYLTADLSLALAQDEPY